MSEPFAQPFKIAVCGGDGIGPEVTREAVRVLQLVSDKTGTAMEFKEGLLGGCAIDAVGTPLPQETYDLVASSDAVLVGASGGPKWADLPPEMHPGPGGLLRLRRELDLYANLRPGVSYLPDRIAVRAQKVDVLFVREAVGGAYFSPKRGRHPGPRGDVAFDTMEYDHFQIERVVEFACRLAEGRTGRLTSIDKAEVLASSALWREVAREVAARHPNVQVEHMNVDNCAMQLVLRPDTFDVMVTENLFGDILSDEAAVLAGSLGLLPSASLGGSVGLYEPIHGSAPDLAGKDLANPIGTILSAAMLLRHSLHLEAEAQALEAAVQGVLEAGHGTADLALAPRREGTRSLGLRIRARLAAVPARA